MGRTWSNVRLWLLVGLSIVLAGGLAVVSYLEQGVGSPILPYACLPLLAVAVAVASVYQFAVRGPEDPARLSLLTSTLAPLIYGYQAWVVTAVVVVALAPGVFVRRPRLVGMSALARWTLGATAGAAVVSAFATHGGRAAAGGTLSPTAIAVLVLALGVVTIVQYAWVLLEGALADRRWPYVVRQPVYLFATAVVHWAVNALLGLLYVFALAGSPYAVVLVPLPLILVYLVSRLYTGALADRQRVETLTWVSRILSDPVDPMTAVEPFLVALQQRFGTRAASLVIAGDGSGRRRAFRLDRDGQYVADSPVNPLERRLLRREGLTRVAATDNTTLARLLREQGLRTCLAAPLVVGNTVTGLILLYEPSSSDDGRHQGAVLETLARQTAHTLSRGWAITQVVQNERSLADILQSTSDGIFVVDEGGTISTWNPACEQITGLLASEVVGKRDALARPEARTAQGRDVDLARWSDGEALPREMVVTRSSGELRQLACSFTKAETADGARLVVVARDITPATEFHELREQFSKLVEMQAAQRLVVDHLQQAVAPEPAGFEGVDIAVANVASDPSAPTGGDLWDWHALPNGELHLAVVDVLGHGVTATRDALTVIHTLRYVAIDGTPLEDLIGRADALLGAQDPELVATAVVARFDPSTGALRVATGGHPPAIIVAPDGTSRQVECSGGAIGWPAAGSTDVAVTRLEEDESLVLYTDGLVEARKDIIEGMATLQRIAEDSAALPARELSDVLVRAALDGAERHDDALALVLRRARRPVRPPQASWDLQPRATYLLRRVRRELDAWMTDNGVRTDDALLVADELLANALAAARSQATLSVGLADGVLEIEVVDDGEGDHRLDERGRTLPVELIERGRGLYLVRQLSLDVTAQSTPSGTTVRARVAAGSLAFD